MTVPAGPPAGGPPNTPPNPAPADPPKPGEGTDTGAGGQQDPKPGDGGEGAGEKKFTQAELDYQIGERLKREREANEAKATKDAEAARTEALREQSKFKELSETQAQQLTFKDAEITQLKADLEASNGALRSQLEAEREGLPAHIIEVLDTMTEPKQLEYISKHRTQLKPASGNGTADPPKPGQTTPVPPAPKAGDTPLSDEDRRKQSFSVRQAW